MKKGINNKLSKYLIIIIAFVTIFINLNHHYWDNHKNVVKWDVISYYQYLPALVHHNDLSFKFVLKDRTLLKYKFWPITTKEGILVGKTSLGMAIIYAPFYAIAEVQARMTNQSTDGFSQPYMFWLIMSALFYLILGIVFLRKLLLLYFSDLTVTLTISLIFFATNLLYYSSMYAAMPHVYLFSLITMFIYFSIKWHTNTSYKLSIFIGILLSLISLIRPTDAIVVIFFLFYNIKSLNDIKKNTILFLKNYKKIVLIVLLSFIFWIPQIIYWKTITGNYLFFSYGNERFFFNNPQIFNSLFSYRKGLFIYSPVLFIAFISIILLYKKNKELFLPIILFTLLNIYIISSWWCWWYGGTYGSRVYIDTFVFFAISLGTLINSLLVSSKKYKFIIFPVIFLFIAHQSFQLLQYKNKAIHYESMSKASYWDSFLRLTPSDKFYSYLQPPNYETCMIDNRFDTKIKIEKTETIFIKTYNNKFLSCNIKKNRRLEAVVEHKWQWELFYINYLNNEFITIMNFEKKIISISDNKVNISENKDINLTNMFKIEKINDIELRLKDYKDKYLFINKNNKELNFSDTCSKNGIFQFIRN